MYTVLSIIVFYDQLSPKEDAKVLHKPSHNRTKKIISSMHCTLSPLPLQSTTSIVQRRTFCSTTNVFFFFFFFLCFSYNSRTPLITLSRVPF